MAIVKLERLCKIQNNARYSAAYSAIVENAIEEIKHGNFEDAARRCQQAALYLCKGSVKLYDYKYYIAEQREFGERLHKQLMEKFSYLAYVIK